MKTLLGRYYIQDKQLKQAEKKSVGRSRKTLGLDTFRAKITIFVFTNVVLRM